MESLTHLRAHLSTLPAAELHLIAVTADHVRERVALGGLARRDGDLIIERITFDPAARARVAAVARELI